MLKPEDLLPSTEGEPTPPTLPELLRAFAIRDIGALYFSPLEGRDARITAESDRLKARIVESKTLTEAFLRYLAETYTGFGKVDRSLIAKVKAETVWDWLDRSQMRSWLVKVAVLLAIGLFVYGVLKVVFFPPLF